MWPGRRDTREQVACVACGERVAREDAREYDKLGDRWDRTEKTFEFLCKPCYRSLSKCPRDGLEGALVDAGAGTVSREEFLARYVDGLTSE